MALYDLVCYALTGGGTGALDAEPGASFDDGSTALVVTDGVNYEFRLDASSGVAESTPWTTSMVIAPDTPDPGNGDERWVLQGIRVASLQLATGVTPTAIANSVTGTSATTLITEAGLVSYVTGIGGLAPTSFPGYAQRPVFTYVDTDQITIGPARYHHNGTAEQIVGWDEDLDYTLSGMSGTDWYYLYLDDTAIVSHGSTTLTASELTHSTTEPTWVAAKGGYYNASDGDDRCIGAFYCSGDNLVDFSHDGGDRLSITAGITESPLANITTSERDIALTIPSFCTQADISIRHRYSSAAASLYVRKNGYSTTNGYFVSRAYSTSSDITSHLTVFTDSSQGIELIAGNSGTQAGVETQAYYFPKGL